jgi:hypothetical protein
MTPLEKVELVKQILQSTDKFIADELGDEFLVEEDKNSEELAKSIEEYESLKKQLRSKVGINEAFEAFEAKQTNQK